MPIIPYWFLCIGPSVGNVVLADEECQINALHFVPKLSFPVYWHQICLYVASTGIQYSILCNIKLRLLTDVPGFSLMIKLIQITYFIHWLVFNESPQLVYTHVSIYSNLILFNNSKYMYHVWMTLCPIYQFWAKTSNNVSEFTHSNWIMPSYYSSPKHKESAS